MKLKNLMTEMLEPVKGTTFIMIKTIPNAFDRFLMVDKAMIMRKGDVFKITDVDNEYIALSCVNGPTKSQYPKEGLWFGKRDYIKSLQKGIIQIIS
mgnify:CR=1 FL=1